MRRTGNIEDAAELYSRLGELDTYSIVPALYWEAERREDLGDYARAAELYDRFARLWADADEPLLNMVTHAQQRAERLLA
ncbi:MAG: hypothetical protein KJO98_14640, partial [Rhodothermia bacterium]|nr:hypothetical protein [Rhodothermia bacterium]